MGLLIRRFFERARSADRGCLRFRLVNALGIIGVFAVAGGAFGAWRVAAPRSQEPPLDRIPVIRCRVTPSGFDLDPEVYLTAGAYLIDVRNATGSVDPITMVLLDEAGVEVARKPVDADRARPIRLDVPPGTYSVTEASHPDWRTTFVVTP